MYIYIAYAVKKVLTVLLKYFLTYEKLTMASRQ